MKKLFSCALIAVFAIAASAQPCSNLFISEYVEGSSFNKAIEIYNPTAASISLTGYKLELYTNGSATASATMNLGGTIAAGGVYVIVNSQASTAIKATGDTIFSNITNFNGDDAIALFSGTTIIDQIGEIGTDPGTEWPVDTGSTFDHTLVRKAAIQQGSTNWLNGAAEWEALSKDTFLLGAHTMTACAPPVDTIVRVIPLAAAVSETTGTYNINIALNQAPAADKTVDITLISGDAADIGNFNSASILIPANSTSATAVISITNDTIAEGSEQFQFALSNASAGLSIDGDSIFTLTITDDDSIAPPPPFYSIATVTTLDANGVPDSNNVLCRVGGTVYGINLRSSGLQFVINDGTGGIGVFSSLKDFGYTVSEGDSVVVGGLVSHFLGYAQIGAQVNTTDTVYFAGPGTLRQPTVVTALDETTESELVRINHVWLTDYSQWDNSNANGFDVDITNGTQTFTMRIDEQTDLFNQPAPTSSFDVIGLGGQFDNNSPYNEGYQIGPRSSDDLLLRVGIHEGVENNFVVYPNPNQGVFTIKLAEQVTKDAAITVKDLAGRNVFAAKSNLSESAVSVDISTLSKGIYIVEVATATSVQRQKVSIQ